MINAQLNLIIPIFIPSKNRYEILSLADYTLRLPSVELEPNQNINELLLMLLNRCLKETSGTNPKLVDITVTSRLDIYYICFVNYETTIINSYTKTIDLNTDILPPNATRTLSLLAK
jgi:hypothetical protein